MKLKTLLIGLMALVISFQTYAYSETKYYPTGEVKTVGEFVNDKISKGTKYYKTGEVEIIQEYIAGKLSKLTVYYKTGKVKSVREYTTPKETKDNQDSFSNKVSNKKTVITCIGNLYDMGIAANGRYAESMEGYWEDVTIIGDVLTAPKLGDYIYRGEQDGKKYWKTSTGAFDTGNPADDKWNWAVLDTNTDKFDISVKKGTIDVMQGKCSPKDKTNWNWN
jgi:hypothetical protein